MWLCAVAALTLTLVSLACGGGTGSLEVSEVCLTAVVEPRWQGAAVAQEVLGRPEEPSRIGVYIDVSTPLGGFLPLSGRAGQETSTLRTLAQLASEHVLRRYGGGGVSIDWRGIGHELAGTKAPRNLTRDDFLGRSTRLELALTEVFADFQSGRAEVAAVVTDLMATDKIAGPLAIAPQIADWLATEDVRSGEFHLALLAVRADYWGVTHRLACPERGGLGCWYSERDREYRRLVGIEKLPLYVVLAGRGRERLVDVTESIHRDLVRLGIEAQWELLTTASWAARETLSCEVFERSGSGERKQPQFVLIRDDDIGFACAKGAPAGLACRLDNGMELSWAAVVQEKAPTDLAPDQVWEPLPFSAAVSGDELVVTVDCGALRDWDWWAPVDTPAREVRLDVAAKAPPSESSEAWESWSSTLEEMGRTVQLTYFVERLRLTPDDYRIVLPPLTVPARGRFQVEELKCPVQEREAEAAGTTGA